MGPHGGKEISPPSMLQNLPAKTSQTSQKTYAQNMIKLDSPDMLHRSKSDLTMSIKDITDDASECPLTPKSKLRTISRQSVVLASPNANPYNATSTFSEALSPYNNQSTLIIPSSPAKRTTSKKIISFNRILPPTTPDRSSSHTVISPSVGGFNSSNLNTPIQFMSPSKVYSDEILHSDEKLQKISNNLKIKLSHAFSKIQNSSSNSNNSLITNNRSTINSIFLDSSNEGNDDGNVHNQNILENSNTLSRPESFKKHQSNEKRSKHKSLPNYLQSPTKPNSRSEFKSTHNQVDPISKNTATLLEPFGNGLEIQQNSPLTSPKKRKQRAIIIGTPINDSIPTYKFQNEDSMLSANDAFQEAISKSSPTKKSRRIVKSISTGFVDESSSSIKLPTYSQKTSSFHSDYDTEYYESTSNNETDAASFEDEKRKEKEAVQSLLSLSCSPLKRKKSFNDYS